MNVECMDGFYCLIEKNVFTDNSGNPKIQFKGLYELQSGKIIKHHPVVNKLSMYNRYYYIPTQPPRVEMPVSEPITSMEELLEVICSKFQIISTNIEIFKYELSGGQRYAQIYRPVLCRFYTETSLQPYDYQEQEAQYSDNFFSEEDRITFFSRFNYLKILLDDLFSIFRTIAPTPENFSCYGFRNRDLIIQACTEVESLCKSTMEANGYLFVNNEGKERSGTTKDYVKLLEPMKLKDYKISFIQHPQIPPFSPFSSWNSLKPTKSIEWYDNYNAIKHDRENSINRATLKTAIESICAVAVLIIAKYGWNNVFWINEINPHLLFEEIPEWKYSEFYIPPFRGENQLPEWEHINHSSLKKSRVLMASRS